MKSVFLLCRDPMDALRHRASIEAGGDLAVAAIAAQAHRARRLIEENPPDVLVTDLTLQDGTVFALLRGLPSARRPKVLVLAPNPDDPALFEALRCGADGFCVAAGTADAVHALLVGQTEMPPAVAAQLLLHFQRDDATGDGNDAFDVVNSLVLSEEDCTLLAQVVEGCTVDDIAALHDTLAQTVRTRLYTLLRKLHWDLRISGLSLQAA